MKWCFAMCPKSTNPALKRHELRMPLPVSQRGIGLPAAVFVITLLAAIAAAISQLVSQNAETFEEEVLLTRAFYAAESGAGLAMGRLFAPEAFPDYEVRDACDAGPWNYEFAIEGLSQCSIKVECTLDATVDAQDYFTITSTGSCANVSRTVQVRTSFEEPVTP